MVSKNVSLKNYNTFRLDYKAGVLLCVRSESEAVEIIRSHEYRGKPFLILGGGSNVLFTNDFDGTIMHPDFEGINIEGRGHDHVTVSAGAGLKWDSFVGWAVDNGFGGIENLSLIPGTVGASPIQNIGAYGVEAKDTIEKVRSVSLDEGTIREFSKCECGFGYRSSIFKNELRRKYLISRVYFRLEIRPSLKLGYGSLEDEIGRMGRPTLENVRKAVMKIRRSKLPDPEVIGNAGSFFKNPAVEQAIADSLSARYPQMPRYRDQYGGIKLSAGWMIEQCGWKGMRIGDAGVHDRQALVLVNYGSAKGSDILRLSEEIKKSVMEKFNIGLEREVEVIGPN